MTLTLRRVGLLLLALTLPACGSDGGDAAPGSDAGDGGVPPVSCDGEAYCADDLWLCRPGIAKDYCMEEQTATVFAPDGTTSVETLPKATGAAVDCFYVYPTVALTGAVGNVPDFSNLDAILVPLRAQAAPLAEVCTVYAPLYHQITLPTYAAGDPGPYLETAYEDVLAAFEFYLKHHNRGRDFVLLGHSQGSHMLRRLLQRRVEPDRALVEKLVVAMPIGPVGDVTVPVGAVVGGSFASLPLCTSPAERGCVVAYDCLTADLVGMGTGPAAGATADAACVNPASSGPGLARFKGSYFPTRQYAGQFGGASAQDLPTNFAVYRDLFSGQCARGTAGGFSLQISYTPGTGDQRAVPLALGTQIMHILDYSFPLEDIVAMLEGKIAAGG